MKQYFAHDEFCRWPEQQKIEFLQDFTITDEQWNDNDFLYQLAVAKRIMNEDYDVLKRLADS
jgi:hypothetical protein